MGFTVLLLSAAILLSVALTLCIRQRRLQACVPVRIAMGVVERPRHDVDIVAVFPQRNHGKTTAAGDNHPSLRDYWEHIFVRREATNSELGSQDGSGLMALLDTGGSGCYLAQPLFDAWLQPLRKENVVANYRQSASSTPVPVHFQCRVIGRGADGRGFNCPISLSRDTKGRSYPDGSPRPLLILGMNFLAQTCFCLHGAKWLLRGKCTPQCSGEV